MMVSLLGNHHLAREITAAKESMIHVAGIDLFWKARTERIWQATIIPTGGLFLAVCGSIITIKNLERESIWNTRHTLFQCCLFRLIVLDGKRDEQG